MGRALFRDLELKFRSVFSSLGALYPSSAHDEKRIGTSYSDL